MNVDTDVEEAVTHDRPVGGEAFPGDTICRAKREKCRCLTRKSRTLLGGLSSMEGAAVEGLVCATTRRVGMGAAEGGTSDIDDVASDDGGST